MKVPEAFVGSMVAFHLGRPVYMFTYGAHIKDQGQELLFPSPIMAPTVTREKLVELVQSNQEVPVKEKLSEVLIGKLIATDADSVTVELMVPDQDGSRLHTVHKAIASALILSADRVTGFDVKGPEAQVRPSPEPSRIVTP